MNINVWDVIMIRIVPCPRNLTQWSLFLIVSPWGSLIYYLLLSLFLWEYKICKWIELLFVISSLQIHPNRVKGYSHFSSHYHNHNCSKIHLHEFVWEENFISLGKIPKNEITGLYSKCLFNSENLNHFPRGSFCILKAMMKAVDDSVGGTLLSPILAIVYALF